MRSPEGPCVAMLLLALAVPALGQNTARAARGHEPTRPEVRTKPRTKKIPTMFAEGRVVEFQGKWQYLDGGASGRLTWIRCEFSERECVEIDAYTLPFILHGSKHPDLVQEPAILETDFRIKSLQGSSMLAQGYSLDRCTQLLLIADFKQKSLHKVVSPAMPMTPRCKKINALWDKLGGKKGEALKEQNWQAILVSTELFGRADPARFHPSKSAKQ